MLKADISGVNGFLTGEELDDLAEAKAAQALLYSGEGAGSDFTGWVRLPENYDREELARIKKAAEKIKSDSKALVVIGIGGSYLGARAAIELLRSPNYNLLPKDTPEIYFAGNNLSGEYLSQIMNLVKDKDFSVNVISKSGTTTEPAVAFRLFKSLLEAKYGAEGARGRIYATTDRAKGALKQLADSEGYETFVVPDDIGGRYSVLTAVGLLPIACAGIDVDGIMRGAYDEMKALESTGNDNPALIYASARQKLFRKGKGTEILACYEPAFRFMAEWWKQLYGESEGKDGKGIFPASVELTADLHSMGQYIQEGSRTLMETVVSFESPRASVQVPFDKENTDGLNYLAGRDMQLVNSTALKATKLAHIDGGVPVMEVKLDKICEYSFGELVYFFEFACGVSGYMSGVNPFNQPGVEAYKKNMFALLGKPGYEELRKKLVNN